MTPADVARQLLEFIGQLAEPQRSAHQRALEGWRDNRPDYGELGEVLATWSQQYVAKLNSDQQIALAYGIIFYVAYAANIPENSALQALRAVAAWPNRMPWDHPDFERQISKIIEALQPGGAGNPSHQTPDVLRLLLTHNKLRPHVVELARQTIAKLDAQLSPAPAPVPESTLLPVPALSQASPPVAPTVIREDSEFRMGAAPEDFEALVAEVCDVLAVIPNWLVDQALINRRGQLVDEWRGKLRPESGFCPVDFMCHFVFSRLDQELRSDYFQMRRSERLGEWRIIAEFIFQRPPCHEKGVANARGFAFWFKAVIDLESQHSLPADIVARVRSKRYQWVFDGNTERNRGLINFATRYLRFLKQRNELDTTAVGTWLQAVQQAAVAKGGEIRSEVREVLPELVQLAKPFGGDPVVSFVLDVIDPAKAKHPWRSEAVFPFLSDEECKMLEGNLKAVRWRAVRTFLTNPNVAERLRQHLTRSLADTAYDRFQLPVATVRGFHRKKIPAVAEARRIFELTNRRHPDYPALEEWYAFALANQDDIMEAQRIWEQIVADERSHEVRWNLAVTYSRVSQPRRALEVLWERGLSKDRAPYPHARFAASLALDLYIERSDSEQAEILRILPNAAAQCYAFALAPPAVGDPGEAQQFNVIRQLANKPIEKELTGYYTPPWKMRNARASLESVSKPLLEMKLKTALRLWLTGYVNLFEKSSVLWEMLYDTWKTDEPTTARLILRKGISNVSYAERDQERLQLLDLLRHFVLPLDQEELTKDRHWLQDVACSSKSFLERRDPRIHDKIWPPRRKVPGPSKARGPWAAMEKLLVRDADLYQLAERVNSCISELLKSVPDGAAEIRPWQEAFDRLHQFMNGARENRADWAEVKELNQWFQGNPPSSCRGTLEPLAGLADWMYGSFHETVRSAKLAPTPSLGRAVADPGIPQALGDRSAAVVLHAPEDCLLEDVRLNVASSEVTSRGPEVLLTGALRSGTSVCLGAQFKTTEGHDDDDPIELAFTGSCTWGIVKNIHYGDKLTYPRFDFGAHLGAYGVNQDSLPKVFPYDRALAVDELPRLFVGREEHLDFLRRTHSPSGALPGTPIYFFGIRRVGKTSLLRRLAQPDVVPSDRFLPLYVTVFGYDPKFPMWRAAERIRSGIVEALEHAGFTDAASAPEIGEAQDDMALAGFEALMSWLRELIAPRLPLLLIDEFHLLAVPRAAPLLDVIRTLHEFRKNLFILAGWLDQEILAKQCSTTQLWPLTQKTINFLSETEVLALVPEQFRSIGAGLADGTVDLIMRLTAGHPNLVQQLCSLATDELNRFRRPVLTVTDIETAATRIVEGPYVEHSWYNRMIVTPSEKKSVNEILAELPHEGGWVLFSNLSDETRVQNLLPLIKKQVLDSASKSGERRVRFKGLLLERYVESISGMTEEEPDPDKPNVALYVDIENIRPLFPPGTDPVIIAGILRDYAESLGNPVVLAIAANWRTMDQSTRVKNAFSVKGFRAMDSFRLEGRSEVDRERGADKNLADFVIVREAYNQRMLDDRESANDGINIYALASGDGGFLELIKDFVEKHRKKFRLLACRDNRHLARDYHEYEATRAQVARTPGRDPKPDFVIDDLTPLMEGRGSHRLPPKPP